MRIILYLLNALVLSLIWIAPNPELATLENCALIIIASSCQAWVGENMFKK